MAGIHEAICAMVSEVEPIAKAHRNKEQGFVFRGIDDVYAAVSPLLAKHKVFPIAEITDEKREQRTSSKGNALYWVRLKIKYTFCASDGSTVPSESMGEAMDSGDKATSKAMSIAYKYALFQLLCIPCEEVQHDPDSQSHDVASCPKCGKSEFVRQDRERGGFYCWKKLGGCSHKWNPAAPHAAKRDEQVAKLDAAAKCNENVPIVDVPDDHRNAISPKAKALAGIRNMAIIQDAGKFREAKALALAENRITPEEALEIEQAIIARLAELAKMQTGAAIPRHDEKLTDEMIERLQACTSESRVKKMDKEVSEQYGIMLNRGKWAAAVSAKKATLAGHELQPVESPF